MSHANNALNRLQSANPTMRTINIQPQWETTYSPTRKPWTVFYRGDTRCPTEIFAIGFRPKLRGGIKYRVDKQDILNGSGVCVTTNPDAAALFPVLVPGENPPAAVTWLYGVRLRKAFNTTKLQAMVAAGGIGGEAGDWAAQNLYANERVCSIVDGKDVLFGVQIERTWAGTGYNEGGRYKILNLHVHNFATYVGLDAAKIRTIVSARSSFAIGEVRELAVPIEPTAQRNPRAYDDERFGMLSRFIGRFQQQDLTSGFAGASELFGVDHDEDEPP